MEVLVIALWSFAVALAGGVAGLVLGNLRLPVLLQFASSPAAGAGANVAVSGLSALTASIAHWRGGRIDWRLFWLMAPPSLLGGIAGGLLSGVLPKRVLLGAIAIVVLYGAVEIARHNNRPQPEEPPQGGVSVALAIAFAVGVLGGLVGLILGTLRLPAMVKWLGTTPKAAVGTNAGAYLGAQLTGRLDDEALLKVISAILVVAGIVLGGEALLG